MTNLTSFLERSRKFFAAIDDFPNSRFVSTCKVRQNWVPLRNNIKLNNSGITLTSWKVNFLSYQIIYSEWLGRVCFNVVDKLYANGENWKRVKTVSALWTRSCSPPPWPSCRWSTRSCRPSWWNWCELAFTFASPKLLEPLDLVNGTPGHFQLDHDVLRGHSRIELFHDEQLSFGFHLCCYESHGINKDRVMKLWTKLVQLLQHH